MGLGMELEIVLEVEKRFEVAKKALRLRFDCLVVYRKAFALVNGSDWSWDLTRNGEEPGLLKMVEVVLKEEIPSYYRFMSQCLFCGKIYVDYKEKKLKRGEVLFTLSEERKNFYYYVQDALNSNISPALTPDIFREYDIEISSGICKFCSDCHRPGEEIRKFQQKEGNPDCYGKSLNHCDQFGCAFYADCLPTKEQVREFPVWYYRMNKLLEFGNRIPFKVNSRG
jgi:hypothetical protein